MNQRTDVHRPSVVVPEDYDFVAFECIKIEGLGDVEAVLRERARIDAHMKRTGGTYSQHAHGGNCMVCGNVFATYTVLFYHAKTNSYVRTGQDCAVKMDMGTDEAGFTRFTAAIKNAREAQAGKKKAQATLQDLGLEAAWQYFGYIGNEREEQIVRDIVSKLVQYGSLSEKQVAFVRSLLERITTRAERLAQRAAETAAAAPVPVTSERIVVTGTILSTKAVTTDFGPAIKMLVKDDTGFKVWGTAPASLKMDNLKSGVRISFKASVTPSKDDPKFGFFKRPYLLTQPE